MDKQTKDDIAFVLPTLLDTADPGRVEALLDELGNTPEQFREAIERIGEKIGMDLSW